ncbi:MAG: hypothetical protein KC776_37750 [Myxococcales bacterium]|nr:hypothetical protein [Myxococcales bacterium]MCB9577213.1 hypothetical protein [Polyangiaceae bacterium]
MKRVGLLLIAVTGAALGKSPVPLPRPAPQLRADTPAAAARRNKACETCHPDIAKEWRSSRHRAARNNAEYRAALAREPGSARGFCNACHAPEGAADLGVGCVTCHVPLGPVLAAPGTGRAPHALLRTAQMQDGDACASCHEFSFPAPNGGSQMQRTMTEHRVAAGAKLGCNGCHMPLVGSGKARHRSHVFAGGHDPALVRSALSVKATRPSAGRVEIRLTPKNVTHAVPTGDLFRRIAVKVTLPDGRVRARYFSRRFRDALPLRQEVSDDRPYRGTTLVALEVPETAPAVRYSVVYERVAHPRGAEEDAAIDGAITIAAGRLPRP